MSKDEKELKSTCVFCMSDQFEFPSEDYQPQHGELIRCANCGRLNDFTSLMLVIEEKAYEHAKEVAKELTNEFTKGLKKKFKGNKFITFK